MANNWPNNWTDNRLDGRQEGRQDWDNLNRSESRSEGRAEDRRGSSYGQSYGGQSYGQSGFSDRTYDPNRYRSDESQFSDERGNIGSRYRDYDRDYNIDRGSNYAGSNYGRSGLDRNQERGYGRDYAQNYGRDYESGMGSNREFGREHRYGDYGRADESTLGGAWNRSTEGWRSDQSRGGSGMGYGGSERFGAGSNYGMSNTDFSRGSSYGRGYGMGDMNYQQRGNYAGRGPKGYQRSDDRIKEEVSEALARHPDIDATEIEIDVVQGLVTLRGSVDDRRTKRMAEDAIESLSGVRDVRNELSVNKSLFERAKEALTGESSSDTSASKSSKTTSKH